MIGTDTLVTLVANTYANTFLDKRLRGREFELLSRLVQYVPVRHVTPHRDPTRIWDLCSRIVADLRSLPQKSAPTASKHTYG